LVGGLVSYAALTFRATEGAGARWRAPDHPGAAVRKVSTHGGGAWILGLRSVRDAPVALPPDVTGLHPVLSVGVRSHRATNSQLLLERVLDLSPACLRLLTPCSVLPSFSICSLSSRLANMASWRRPWLRPALFFILSSKPYVGLFSLVASQRPRRSTGSSYFGPAGEISLVVVLTSADAAAAVAPRTTGSHQRTTRRPPMVSRMGLCRPLRSQHH